MPEPIRAPELTTTRGWLNTDRPLLLGGELRGQVVVLDFWTYCCINCMHILPDLAYLEEKYRHEPVLFIGVHSAKFSNEGSRETIRAAIQRYEIGHPVVIDDAMTIWRSYAVRSWPTLVVIDPRGYVVTVAAGEGNRDTIDQAIAQTLVQSRSAGTLAARPLSIRRESAVAAASGLAFPGKVLADPVTKRLYVADSNHNRIVIAEFPGEAGQARVICTVGRGDIGQDDGPADQATFNHPQGMAVGQGNLYVADTENHLIRAIDHETWAVRTVVGTGRMENDRAGGGMGRQQGLNSPWDLAIEGSTLYVAMAGTHQIWRIDMPVGFARALAGNGRENIVDGPTETAALAQPSGICVLNGRIYFADSEVSAIRGIDMASEQVFTIIGEGLFSFGDIDGVFLKAKLQHPLGVAAWGMSLLVADTYNHKIKLIDPAARSATTLYGTGSANVVTSEGKVAFFEPGGLAVCGNELYVADTNNHRIIRINLISHAWQEVSLEGLEKPSGVFGASAPEGEVIEAQPFKAAKGHDLEMVLDVRLPEDQHFSPEAPWSVRIHSGERTLLQHTGKSESMPLRVRVPASAIARNGIWSVALSFASCTKGAAALCMPHERTWRVPIAFDGSDTMVTLEAP